MKEIHFYQTESGHNPITDFLDSLSSKQAQKVIWVLKLIEEMDNIPTQYLKKLVNTDDIWEVRVVISGNAFRLLGFFEDEQLIVLNHAFQKKTQKTPLKDIKLAETRKREYLSRKMQE
ncbi:type II toxin-antitoxin system RelE/ParE family toxin [Candidatus Albibeggiatoa sp. nov. NOAA]|uniref:type II toxin-antitoxin system RelE/ParE family toxin n=1 Tax=Candidatus Albibeggiatoa sp. nov. NOAA TaxID=3162724 RepID=UPI0032F47042|nr:type II toxin-antitoxin system RelE/ParE family toxin [Thiotrichaceae bacterium]